MTLPTFEDIMLPLLQYLSDNKERRYSETKEYLAEYFKSKQDDRAIAEEIIEGLLLAAQREYEEKKLPFYGN